MLEALKNIIKKVIGEEEYEEMEVSLAISDGCKGEEAFAKILEKLKGDEPC